MLFCVLSEILICDSSVETVLKNQIALNFIFMSFFFGQDYQVLDRLHYKGKYVCMPHRFTIMPVEVLVKAKPC